VQLMVTVAPLLPPPKQTLLPLQLLILCILSLKP
jgi:hypothetical protein